MKILFVNVYAQAKRSDQSLLEIYETLVQINGGVYDHVCLGDFNVV